MRKIYRLFWYLATPCVPLYLRRRLKRHKEEAAYIGERYGYGRHAPTKKRLLWLHAASVGEVNSVLPLIKRIHKKHAENYSFLLTTSSRNGQKIAQKSLPQYVALQYLPLDHPTYAKRFIDHYRPYAALWVEQELWPNLLTEAHRQGVRLTLINGRLTEKSLRRWRYASGFAAEVANLFETVLAQSPQDADNFNALGFRARYIGNLKALPIDIDEPDKKPGKKPGKKSESKNISAILPRGKRLWLAASLHLGEEVLCYEAHKLARRTYENLFLLLVPRYPEEARRMRAAAARLGLRAVLYSELRHAEEDADCLIIDAFGLLSALYNAVDAAFLGGSSGAVILGKDCGGHNPLEAVSRDCIVIAGCDMRNFSYISEKLAEADSLLFTKAESRDLARALKETLSDEVRRKRVLDSNRSVLAELSGQAEATSDVICDWLGD